MGLHYILLALLLLLLLVLVLFNPLVPSVPKNGRYKKLDVKKRHSIFK